jgi:hypothetical protein
MEIKRKFLLLKLQKLLLLSCFAALVYSYVNYSNLRNVLELGGVKITEKQFDTDNNTNIDDDNIDVNIDIINDNAGNNDDNIQIIETSTPALQSDILKITHAPNKGLITIHFETPRSSGNSNDNINNDRTRQCFNPIVRGRLSGPSLAIIEWTDHISEYEYDQQNHANNTAASPSTRTHTRTMTEKITGQYQVPQTGTYYIEIIGIVCNHKFHIKEHNFMTDTCLINPSHHRLTAIGASINVTEEAVSTSASNSISNNLASTSNHFNTSILNTTLERSRQGSRGTLGYWKRRNEMSTLISTGTNGTHDYDYDPLYTRYQPPQCRRRNAALPHCKDATDLKRFEPYTFVFNNDIQSFIDKSFELHSNSSSAQDQQQQPLELSSSSLSSSISSKKTICAVGQSHSRGIIGSMTKILTDIYNNTLNIGTRVISVKYPNELHNITSVNDQIANTDKTIENCTHIVVGLGQWSAGWPEYSPTLFDQYESEMEEAMNVLLKAREEIGFQLFFRSMQ